MKTIKINSFEQLMSHAATIISNNQADLSTLPFGEMLPYNMGENYQQLLSRFEGLTDSSANLSEPRDIRIAQSLAAVGKGCFSDLANINGALLAEQVAMNMAAGQSFGKVKFEVSEEAVRRLEHERNMQLAGHRDCMREAYGCIAAMNSVVNGVPFDMNEYYSHLVEEYERTEEIDLDETEFDEPEPDETEFEDTLSEITDRMSELTGDDFDELSTAEGFNEFTGEREYRAATFRINMSGANGLTMDNYRERLRMGASAEDKQWCTDTVNGMFRSFYGEETYNQMVMDGADMFSGVFVDGAPAAMLYNQAESYEQKCALLMRGVLDGGHRLNISPLEKGTDGSYTRSDTICEVEVQPSLEAQEEFSLWKAILRFFGFHIRTKAEKLEERVSFAEMENQEAVESIRALNRSDSDYSRMVQPIAEERQRVTDLTNTVEQYAFRANLTDPTAYFSEAVNIGKLTEPTEFDEIGSSNIEALKTLGRQPSRTSIVTLLMLSEGMTMEQIANPDAAAQQRMKDIGREFIDTVTMPETPLAKAKREHPEFTKAQLAAEIRKPEVQEEYNRACSEKLNGIAAMYERVGAALHAYEAALPQADLNNINSIAACTFSHQFFETASCDVYQTLQTEPFLKGAQKDSLKPLIDYSADSQAMCPAAPLSKALTNPDLTENCFRRPDLILSGLANALADKQYGLMVHNGMENNSMVRNMTTLTLGPSFSREINQLATRDPQGVITYAKDLLTGRKPMPADLATATETNFTQCYLQDKQRSVPTLQMDRTNQR